MAEVHLVWLLQQRNAERVYFAMWTNSTQIECSSHQIQYIKLTHVRVSYHSTLFAFLIITDADT